MSDKKLRILEMIEKKKITAEEGMELLRILEKKERREKQKMERAGNLPVVERGSGTRLQRAQRADVVKLSENEYEILPAEGSKQELRKKPFGNIPFLGGRKLVIRIEEKGKTVVNLRFPMTLASVFMKSGLKMAKNSSAEASEILNGIDAKELERLINSGQVGELIHIYDEEDDTRVYIGIE